MVVQLFMYLLIYFLVCFVWSYNVNLYKILCFPLSKAIRYFYRVAWRTCVICICVLRFFIQQKFRTQFSKKAVKEIKENQMSTTNDQLILKKAKQSSKGMVQVCSKNIFRGEIIQKSKSKIKVNFILATLISTTWKLVRRNWGEHTWVRNSSR